MHMVCLLDGCLHLHFVRCCQSNVPAELPDPVCCRLPPPPPHTHTSLLQVRPDLLPHAAHQLQAQGHPGAPEQGASCSQPGACIPAFLVGPQCGDDPCLR